MTQDIPEQKQTVYNPFTGDAFVSFIEKLDFLTSSLEREFKASIKSQNFNKLNYKKAEEIIGDKIGAGEALYDNSKVYNDNIYEPAVVKSGKFENFKDSKDHETNNVTCAICPYCPVNDSDDIFANMYQRNNLDYIKHMAYEHGVLSNGIAVEAPVHLEWAEDPKIEIVKCLVNDCDEFVALHNFDPHEKPLKRFSEYIKHMQKYHGSEKDLLVAEGVTDDGIPASFNKNEF